MPLSRYEPGESRIHSSSSRSPFAPPSELAQQAAQVLAMEAIEKELRDNQFKQTYLNRVERQKYFKGVMDDIESNRHSGANDSNSGIFSIYASLGGPAAAIFALSKASAFYWHTSEHDVESISKIKFHREINIAGHQIITKSLPMNTCIAYNHQTQSYHPCKSFEEDHAQPLYSSAPAPFTINSMPEEL